MNINMIAAIGKNNELGKNGNLIWNLKEDMKFFKQTTMGHTIVMGRNTFDSLPKILPGRNNVVITSRNDLINDKIEVYKSIRDFLVKYKDCEEELFIIGGSKIYEQFIDMANKLYLTEIDAIEPAADVYFPQFNKLQWEREELSLEQENDIYYKHVLYKR